MFSAGEGGDVGSSLGSSSKMVEGKQDQPYGIGDVITYIAVNEDGSKSYPMLCVTEVLQNGVKGIDLRRHKPETFGKEIEITFGSKYSFYNIQKQGVDRDALEKIIEETPERLMAFIST